MINLYYATWTAPVSRRRRVSVARSIRGDNGKTEKQSSPSIVHGEGNKKGVTRVSLGELREQVLINGGREGTTGEESVYSVVQTQKPKEEKMKNRSFCRFVPRIGSCRYKVVPSPACIQRAGPLLSPPGLPSTNHFLFSDTGELDRKYAASAELYHRSLLIV